jgi:hypothetical protein
MLGFECFVFFVLFVLIYTEFEIYVSAFSQGMICKRKRPFVRAPSISNECGTFPDSFMYSGTSNVYGKL